MRANGDSGAVASWRMRALLIGLCALLGCGPNPPAPVRVMAVVPVESGSYETREVQLTTIANLTNLRGSIAELTGLNRVIIDPNDPLQRSGIENLTPEQRFEVLVKDKGVPVRGAFLERAGVQWPVDFHTWNMVSTYWNFENAYLYFQELFGAFVPPLTPDELTGMKVFYFPELRINDDKPVVDNALYLSFVRAFVVAPFEKETRVPMGMNLGVVGHEVAHKVFSKRVYNDEGIPLPIRTWNGEPFNLLKSLDEGLADFHGAQTTCRALSGCRSDFLAISISDESYSRQRDISRADACLDENLRQALKSFSQDQWVRSKELYLYGNLWAVSLYQAGISMQGQQGVKTIAQNLLAAYDDTGAKPGLNQLITRNANNQMAFTPEAVASAISSHVPNVPMRMRLCGELMDRLQLQCTRPDCSDKLPDCAGAIRRTTCKVLPPLP